jgi:hypothetical protein
LKTILFVMKPWQAPLNKASSEGGKRKNKERGPKSEPHEQNPKRVTKGKGTNYFPEPSPVTRSILKKESEGKSCSFYVLIRC